MTENVARGFAMDLAERIRRSGKVAVRRFFGGAALVVDGLQIGFVMKGSLYLRVDDASRAQFEAMGSAPFTYAGAGRTATVARYYETPAEILDDTDKLCDWVQTARRAAFSDGNSARAREHRPSTMKKQDA